MKILALTCDSIDSYEVKLDKKGLINLQREELLKLQEKKLLLKYFLDVSYGDDCRSQFEKNPSKYLLKDCLEVYDFYDWTSNYYGTMEHVSLNLLKTNDVINLNEENSSKYNAFMVELFLKPGYKKPNNECFYYEKSLVTEIKDAKGEIYPYAYYLVTDPNASKSINIRFNYNESIFQVPFLLFYLNKVLQGKMHFLNDALEKKLEVSELLKFIKLDLSYNISLDEHEKYSENVMRSATHHQNIISKAKQTTTLVEKILKLK